MAEHTGITKLLTKAEYMRRWRQANPEKCREYKTVERMKGKSTWAYPMALTTRERLESLEKKYQKQRIHILHYGKIMSEKRISLYLKRLDRDLELIKNYPQRKYDSISQLLIIETIQSLLQFQKDLINLMRRKNAD